MFLYLSVFIVFSGLLVFCSMRKHLLLTLLSLEFMVLGLYLMFFVFVIMYDIMGYIVLVFLTFSVCEGSIGLSILVSIIRSHGNDSILGLSLLEW
nr:NADH dehydrogenase subunit 4L [Ptilocnemus lemur]